MRDFCSAMNNLIVFIVLVWIVAVAGATGPWSLTIEQISPAPRHNLTHFNIKFKKESQVILGCNMTHPKNIPDPNAVLRWEYKVLQGNVQVQNSTYKNNQANVTLTYDTKKMAKSSVNVTCFMHNNKLTYNSTWFLIHNEGVQISAFSLLPIMTTAFLVALRSS